MIPVWCPSLPCAAAGLPRNPSRSLWSLCGISKSQSSVDYAMLEYCIREDLKLNRSRMMAVLDPIKLVIDNYPEGQVEELDCHQQPGKRRAGYQNRALLPGAVH